MYLGKLSDWKCSEFKLDKHYVEVLRVDNIAADERFVIYTSDVHIDFETGQKFLKGS